MSQPAPFVVEIVDLPSVVEPEASSGELLTTAAEAVVQVQAVVQVSDE